MSLTKVCSGTFLDSDRYLEILKRKKKTKPQTSRPWQGESLLGRKIIHKQEVYTVVEELEHWFCGWYKVLVLKDKCKSGCLVMWENISSCCDIILQQIEQNKIDYTLISE